MVLFFYIKSQYVNAKDKKSEMHEMTYFSSRKPRTKYQNVLKIHGVFIITHFPKYSS